MAKKPDYRLSVRRKADKATNYDAGGAWQNEDGSISLLLNPGVALSGTMMEGHTLRLWPVEEGRKDPSDGDATQGGGDAPFG